MKFFVPTLSILLISIASVFAQFKMPMQYTADQSIQSEGHKIDQKLFMNGDKLRMEINASGVQATTIMRKDKNMVYVLIPAEKFYLEMPIDPKDPNVRIADILLEKAPTLEAQGQETIRNLICDKYKITGKDFKGTMWIAKSDQHPVRIATLDGTMTIDWDNYKAGAPADDLFEVPSGYQKMSMPDPSSFPGQ